LAIYMNNGATTWPKPACVPGAMADFLTKGGANLARGTASDRDLGALDMVLTCREELADLFGAPGGDPRNITFTSSVTESLNVILKGFLKPGMTVVTSSMEHNALIRPLRRLESKGVIVRIVECDPEGFLPPGDFAESLEGASLAAISHASNVNGTVQDLEALGEACRERGVPLAVDCAQTGGILPIDAQKLGLVALCFTGHKGLMGPQGIGGIVWSPDFAERTDWFVEGGTGSFSEEELHPSAMPDKFEAGTPNLPGIAGLLAALKWIRETGMENIRRREEALGALLLEGLKALPGVAVSGRKTMEGRLPVFAVNFDGRDNAIVAARLSEEWGVETRPGLHCAPLAHKTLGTFPGGALRISPGWFTTEEEINQTIHALKGVLS
jgi:cysteine desulfurase family protein